MSNKPHDPLPAIIIDWLSAFAFNELNAMQQSEVLLYISEEEYNQLHLTTKQIQSHASIPHAPGKEQRKAMLLDAFDRKHAQVRRRRLQPLIWWRAAAILLFCSTGCLGYYALHRDHALESMVHTTIDTLYVTKEIAAAPVKIMDTIFIEKASGSKRNTAMRRAADNGGYAAGGSVLKELMDVSVVPVSAVNNACNNTRGNSMKYDTLNKLFSFISL